MVSSRLKIHIRNPFFLLVVIMLFISTVSPATGAENRSNAWQFNSLAGRLIRDGFAAQRIQALYADPKAAFETRGVSLYFVHSEAKLNYDQFTSRWAIRRAIKYQKKHRDILNAIEQKTGVDPHVITAIILVETGLGNTLGSRSIFNTLSSLAALNDTAVQEDLWKKFKNKYDLSEKEFEATAGRKAKWAYRELKAFLKFADREKFDPLTVVGSYAGALGIPQFMPTTALAYAEDGNRDGRIDLFDHADAMASIAGFLKRFGWRPGIDSESARKVIYRYNHSSYYVDTILEIRRLLKG